MAKKSKVSKFKKRRTINVGHIVFLIIFIYISISIYIYMTKNHLTIYEVRKGTIAKENVYNGLILRDEEVYNTSMAGYVYYYYKDGDRIPKNSAVYSINENERATSLVTSDLDSESLTKAEVSKVKNEISNFRYNYSNSNYSTVYDFKYNLNNVSLEIVNEKNQDSLGEFINETGGGNSQVVNSNKSGVVTYYTDGFEDLKSTDVTNESFKSEDYEKILLRKDSMYESDVPAYKLITDNTWSIIISLSEEVYNYLAEEDTGSTKDVTIRFIGEGLESPGNMSYYKNGDEYFAKITLDYYMEKFINQRFVEIQLNIDENTGLKIPTSAIIDKEFYLIPHEYFTQGGDSKEAGLILETRDEENEVVLTFTPTEIFYEDEEHSYVNTLLFEPNSWIYSESGNRLKLNEKATLKGVFNVNKGYAVFRRVEIIEESSEYTVVKEGTSYGLTVYDQIALVGATAIEQQIIY